MFTVRSCKCTCADASSSRKRKATPTAATLISMTLSAFGVGDSADERVAALAGERCASDCDLLGLASCCDPGRMKLPLKPLQHADAINTCLTRQM